MDKTNVMRVLDKGKIPYTMHHIDKQEAVSANELAEILGIKEETVFKTLVTVGKSKKYYVFMLPANGELDLKKAAKAANEKSIEMLPSKELLPLTGYVHGGCSPIGMKKQFPTFIDASVTELDTFLCSGGKIGYQVELTLENLQKAIRITVTDLKKEN